MLEQPTQFSDYLWLLPTFIGGFAVKFLRELAKSVAELAKGLAVMATRVDDHHESIEDHEERLRKVELQ